MQLLLLHKVPACISANSKWYACFTPSDGVAVVNKLIFFVYQVELEQTLQESQYREQQLELTISNLQNHLEKITEEKEKREKEAVSWYNALEVNKAPFNYDCTENSKIFNFGLYFLCALVLFFCSSRLINTDY